MMIQTPPQTKEYRRKSLGIGKCQWQSSAVCHTSTWVLEDGCQDGLDLYKGPGGDSNGGMCMVRFVASRLACLYFSTSCGLFFPIYCIDRSNRSFHFIYSMKTAHVIFINTDTIVPPRSSCWRRPRRRSLALNRRPR